MTQHDPNPQQDPRLERLLEAVRKALLLLRKLSLELYHEYQGTRTPPYKEQPEITALAQAVHAFDQPLTAVRSQEPMSGTTVQISTEPPQSDRPIVVWEKFGVGTLKGAAVDNSVTGESFSSIVQELGHHENTVYRLHCPVCDERERQAKTRPQGETVAVSEYHQILETLENAYPHQCNRCKAQGLSEPAFVGEVSETTIGYFPQFGFGGKNPNIMTTEFRCMRGHSWKMKNRCSDGSVTFDGNSEAEIQRQSQAAHTAQVRRDMGGSDD